MTGQANFAAALLDASAPLPDNVVSHTSRRPVRRFAVYRNNVVSKLIDVLAGHFPAVQKIVGDEFFRAMAQVFVIEHPPTSPVLLHYGEEFPAFVAAFPPVHELPYLADVARVEVAWVRAYHAPDARSIGSESIVDLTDDAVADLTLRLHPTLSVIRSPHPIVAIWAMNAGPHPVRPIEHWEGEDALVIRPELDVSVHRLGPGSAAFIDALASGQQVRKAVREAVAEAPDFDPRAAFIGLFRAGLVVEIETHARGVSA